MRKKNKSKTGSGTTQSGNENTSGIKNCGVSESENKTKDCSKNASEEKTARAFARFYKIIKTLRAPGGCPWDRAQTPVSMRRDLLEETFETLDALSEKNDAHVKEELGDALLNILMISYMHEQENKFSVSDVLDSISKKLVRRHPHVFSESAGNALSGKKVSTPDEVLLQWDAIKENVEGRRFETILDEVPKDFPPLLYAYKIQKKAGKKGFDWKTASEVEKKLAEEFSEMKEALKKYESNKNESAFLDLEAECGDVLFALVNYFRHIGVDASLALSRTNKKFYKRFSYVEKACKEKNIPMDGEHLAEEEAFWNEAKRAEMPEK